jgi:hypothetical protein
MIRKSGNRFSEKILLTKQLDLDPIQGLGGAATFRKYRTFESDFLNGLDATTILPLGSQ